MVFLMATAWLGHHCSRMAVATDNLPPDSEKSGFLLGFVVPECGDPLWQARLLPVRPTRDALISKLSLGYTNVGKSSVPIYFPLHIMPELASTLSDRLPTTVSFLESQGFRGYIQGTPLCGTIALLPRQPQSTIISDNHHGNLKCNFI